MSTLHALNRATTFATPFARDPETTALELAAYLDGTMGIEAETDETAQAAYFRIGEVAGGLGESLVADVTWLLDTAEDRVRAEFPSAAEDHYGWTEATCDRAVRDARECVARDWLRQVEPMVEAARRAAESVS